MKGRYFIVFLFIALTGILAAKNRASATREIQIRLPITQEWADALADYCERRDETIAEALSEYGVTPIIDKDGLKIDRRNLILHGIIDWQAARFLVAVMSDEKSNKKQIDDYLNKAYLERFEGPFALPKSEIVDNRLPNKRVLSNRLPAVESKLNDD